MGPRAVAERAAFIPAVIGPVFGALFLFAPIQRYCITTVTATAAPAGATPGPPATAGPATCGVEALWQRQQLFPMPFFAVVIWSLGPVLAYYGVRRRHEGHRRSGTSLMVIGLLMTLSSIISIGGGLLFVPFVFLPMLIATAVALRQPSMG